MFKISKDFHFSAAHQLKHLPETHKCHHLHGHNYIVRIMLTADQLDPDGFVLDYSKLDKIKTWIDQTLDHKYLNDIFDKPTAENMAKSLYERYRGEYEKSGISLSISVSETPKTWATYGKN